MSLANYSDLKTAVANWLKRSDLTSIIPDFIELAEIRINGDLDARLQDTKTTLTTVAGTEYVALPTDTINIRHLSVSSVNPIMTLTYMSPDALETTYPWDVEKQPEAYTVIGSDIYLAPIPDSAYTLDLVYKAKVPSLSASETTWLMTSYPHVYLYATLCEAAPYLKDDNRIQVWEGKYAEAVKSVNAQDWYSGSTIRVKTDVHP